MSDERRCETCEHWTFESTHVIHASREIVIRIGRCHRHTDRYGDHVTRSDSTCRVWVERLVTTDATHTCQRDRSVL